MFVHYLSIFKLINLYICLTYINMLWAKRDILNFNYLHIILFKNNIYKLVN